MAEVGERAASSSSAAPVNFDPLINGAKFKKFCDFAKPHDRDVKISLERHVLYWKSPRKSEAKTTIPFSAIKEVREGHKTKRFRKADPATADLSFSVIYGGSSKSLDLVAENKDVRDIWVGALRELCASSKDVDPIKIFLQQAWRKADKNGDNQLDLDEVIKLLKSLNLNLSKSEVKATFKNVAKEKGYLDFEGFTEFYKHLKYREEVAEIFAQIAKADPNHASLEELKKFLNDVQRMGVDDEQLKALVKKHGTDSYSNENGLSLEGFSNLLVSEARIWKKDHLVVHQDMSRPLTHYWINSSHNTYLMADQLKGPSSVEAYVRAFQLGCRCVELDCWDGPDGNPIVYHGHTLTSKILFEDVVKTVKDYAFVASEYPVILSLEVHTSVEQQDRMADILLKHLGDMISTEPLADDAAFLPSPESLKRRILIKGKALPRGVKTEEYDTEDEDDDDEDEPEEVKQMKASEGKKQGSKVKISQKLSDLVNYCKTAHFKTFEESKEKGRPDQMSSFAEGKSEKLSSAQRAQFIEYNRKQLSRIYPAGGRVDSSNYAPHLHWNAGCQIVAFNFQTLDRTMQLNLGKFAFNGGAGYILKPEWMLQEGGKKPSPKKFKVTIISGQQLPKPGQTTKGEIIDPYVEVDVMGEEQDCVSKKTKVINDNGFNPHWNETFDFNITSPDLTLVRFAVYDKDINSDDFIASATVNFESMEVGYRHIPLRDSKNSSLDLSFLFVKIEITDA